MRNLLIIIVTAAAVLTVALMSCGRHPGEREFNQGLRELEAGRWVRAKNLFEKSISRRPGSMESASACNGLGIANWHLNQIEAAIKAFEESLRLNPELAEPAYNLGVLYYRSGDTVQALQRLEETSLRHKEDTRALEYAAYIHMQEENWAEARTVLQGAAARAANSPRIATMLSLAEMKLAGPEMAGFHLMQALDKNAEYGPALYNLGLLCKENLNNPEQAFSYLSQYVELNPHGPRISQARAMIEQCRPAAAKAEEKPGPSSPKQESAQARPESIVEAIESSLQKARAESAGGNARNALNHYLKAASDAGRSGATARQGLILEEAAAKCPELDGIHAARGGYWLSQGKTDFAMQAYKKAVDIDPRQAASQLGLANAALAAGEYDIAASALKKAVALAPENPDALWSLAELYESEELDWTDRAMECYRQFEQLFPGDPRVLKARAKLFSTGSTAPEAPAAQPAPPEQPAPAASDALQGGLQLKKPRQRLPAEAAQAFNRGYSFQLQEDWDRAIYFYRHALENDDTFLNAYFNLGVVYQLNKEPALAKEAYLAGLEQKPGWTDARYNLALLFMELRQYSEAEEQARKILELDPKHAQSHYILGMIYESNPQRKALARQHWQRFIELAPNDPLAPDARSRLDGRR
ncbi:MAG: tetratricopeptide repeat protein [Kiritimatiellia bacterium]